jgi:hypothetical protein
VFLGQFLLQNSVLASDGRARSHAITKNKMVQQCVASINANV